MLKTSTPDLKVPQRNTKRLTRAMRNLSKNSRTTRKHQCSEEACPSCQSYFTERCDWTSGCRGEEAEDSTLPDEIYLRMLRKSQKNVISNHVSAEQKLVGGEDAKRKLNQIKKTPWLNPTMISTPPMLTEAERDNSQKLTRLTRNYCLTLTRLTMKPRTDLSTKEESTPIEDTWGRRYLNIHKTSRFLSWKQGIRSYSSALKVLVFSPDENQSEFGHYPPLG